MTRLPAGGHLDRATPLRFTFDGRQLSGFAGDTLASALLANGIHLVGRSFKYHRPRGVFTAGVEEPNALVELRAGARREPNTRATVTELFDGLEASSQNRLGSLAFDALAVNGLVSPFIGAGFYYKTFMWPPAFWEKLYEPLIRRAAGLGRAAMRPDPDRYEHLNAHCDVLVVGSGAAGLAAARAAAAAGARVILAEQEPLFGGGLLLEPGHEAWRREMLAAIAATAEIRLLPRTTVLAAYEGNHFAAVERVADHLAEPPASLPRQRFHAIHAAEAVFAAGAHERLIAFPGNDRPGVMLAGAGLAYMRRWAVRAGDAVVLFATNDAAYDAAFALADAGARISAIVDPREDSPAMAQARRAGFRVEARSEVCGTTGRLRITGVGIRRLGAAGRGNAHAADLLLLSGGWNPAVHLASMAGTALRFDALLHTFLPDGAAPGTRSAGACRGINGIAAAAADGAQAGADAAQAAGFARRIDFTLPDGPAASHAPYPLHEVRARGKAFVDLQDDVTAEDIRLACREGYSHIELAKRYTTHAMGTDQGKTGGIVGAAVLAEARGEKLAQVGLPRMRPFYAPAGWGAVAGAHAGRHFAPTRRTALHRWHERAGAAWLDAGVWKRPAYYPKPGDADAWASVRREARVVRQDVGVCDVSTLGKIELRGPDAADFLDRIYANTMSTLVIGRARYGLMLREDGIVFDDGTVSRLGRDHYLMTTTTTQAAAVMQHLEFHLQTVWPAFDVSLVTVTDQWAAMSVAGPRSREVLARIVDGVEITDAAFPFMAVAECRAAGAPARLFRISFSGERAYEIAVPAGYAEHVWQALVDAGAQPYGIEAVGLLRVEKGHVAGAELNGQTTAHDLGLGRMLKRKGDFVGRVLAGRPGLTDPDRPGLVGVVPLDPARRIRAGSHLLEREGGPSLGWITSATHGVARDGWLGLAMLSRGQERMGSTMTAANPLMDDAVPVRIVSPHHYDPENTRVRG